MNSYVRLAGLCCVTCQFSLIFCVSALLVVSPCVCNCSDQSRAKESASHPRRIFAKQRAPVLHHHRFRHRFAWGISRVIKEGIHLFEYVTAYCYHRPNLRHNSSTTYSLNSAWYHNYPDNIGGLLRVGSLNSGSLKGWKLQSLKVWKFEILKVWEFECSNRTN